MPRPKATVMSSMSLINLCRSLALKPLILSCATLMLPWTASWADGPPVRAAISGPLQAAIRIVAPNSKVLQPNEINMRECESVPKSPGLARADFNGDGLEDAAAILKTHVAGDVRSFEGRKYRKAELLFVIFINDGKGGYLTRTQDKYNNQIPAMMFVDVIPPRKIRSIEEGKDVDLKNPAVMLTFCGQSAAAYVVTGSTVRGIPLSD